MSNTPLSRGHLWVVPASPPAVPVLPLALQVLDQLDCALLACNPVGLVLLSNHAARRELDTARVLAIDQGRLRGVAGSQQALALLLGDAALRRRSRLQWLGDGEHRMMVAAMPAGDRAAPLALVVLGRRSLCSPLGLEMLAIEHGLTPAERRVMRALVSNHAPRQIASDHGVAMSTVRTQIIAIRNKLGVRNIDALMLRAAQVPPVTSGWESAPGSEGHPGPVGRQRLAPDRGVDGAAVEEGQAPYEGVGVARAGAAAQRGVGHVGGGE